MQPSNSSARLKYVPALDGLRGLAVAGVVLFHLGYLHGGFLAVDFFFTLSGFLITSLLLNEWTATRRISLGAFWMRRVKRLMPAILLLLFVVALYGRFFATAAETAQIRTDGLWVLGYAANWHAVISDHGYWAQFTAPSPLDHFWSLAIEEQFYLVWPLITAATLAIARGRRAIYGGLCAVLAVASGAAMILMFHPGGDPSRVYQGTDTRAAAILLGALLAVVFEGRAERIRGRGRGALEIAAGVAAAAVAAAWIAFDGSSTVLYRGGFFALGIAATVLIAASAHPQRGLLGRALSIRPLVALGAISYGLYLWHYPIILWLTPARVGVDGVALDVVRVSVALAASIASYAIIERPVRLSKPRAIRVAVAVPVALAASLGVLMVATRAEQPDTTTARVVYRPTATPAQGGAASQARAAAPQPPPRLTVLVVGDSVAERLARGMKAVAPPNVTIVDGSRLACPIGRAPALHIFGKDDQRELCALWPQKWGELVAENHPDAVVGITGPWDRASARLPNADHFSDITDPTHEQWLRGEYRDALDVLTSDGAHAFWTKTPCVDPIWPGPDPFSREDRRLATDAMLDRLADETGLTVLPLPAYECHGGVDMFDGIHWDDDVGARVGAGVLTELIEELTTGAADRVPAEAAAASR